MRPTRELSGRFRQFIHELLWRVRDPHIALYGNPDDPALFCWVPKQTDPDEPGNTFAIYIIGVHDTTPDSFWAPILRHLEPHAATDFDPFTNRYTTVPQLHRELIARKTEGLSRSDRRAFASGQAVFHTPHFEGLAINAATVISLFAFGVSTVRSARWGWLRIRKNNPSRCRSCGYSLVGLPSVRCPECGKSFFPCH